MINLDMPLNVMPTNKRVKIRLNMADLEFCDLITAQQGSRGLWLKASRDRDLTGTALRGSGSQSSAGRGRERDGILVGGGSWGCL